MGKVSCAICKKRCRGAVLKIDNHYLHKLCFKCHKCEKPLDEKSFHFRDGCLYCPEDYHQEYVVKCAACGNSVEGEVVTALDNTFHTFCLRCFSCNRIISSGEKTVGLNGQFYCEKCFPREDSADVEASSPAKDPPAEATEAKMQKRVPKSPSLPQRFGELFRSKKMRSQTLQPINRSARIDQSTCKSTTLSNGTAILSVKVDGADMPNAESGVEKKVVENQSPNYSLYSGEDCVPGKKEHNMQPIPAESSGTSGVPYTYDAAPTTPSMLNTLSGETSTILFDSVRRICPPGVDYGHQYPVSYLRLAEQGYTAVTSLDLLNSDSPRSVTTTPLLSSAAQRLSRRDMPSAHAVQTRTMPTSSVSPGGLVNHRYAPQVFGEIDGGRPIKDRYTRYRQLSPASVGSMSRAVSSGRGVAGPPNFLVRKSHTYSSYSTPNVNSRRGIRVLAESMMRSPPRVGRSLSPEAALSAQAEARRLAAYPGAKIPDADSEPAIDRYDWPAPPSPAVVMIDRRREKAMKSATLQDNRTITKSEESSSDTRTLSPGNAHSPSPEKEAGSNHVEDKISALKRATGNSGMSAAVAQYVESEERRKRSRSPDLDPISASRSPNASFEPSYSTRYASHRFASPSRSTLRREEPRGNYSASPILPRPGYTSGILSSRPLSLPRGVNAVSTTLPPWTSTLSPSQRKIYTSNASRTLPVNGTHGPLSDSRDGTFSFTTSGLSMDGLEATTAPPVLSNASTSVRGSDHRARSTTLIGGLPPPAISGLRPVGRRSYNFLTGTSYELSRSRPTNTSAINGWRGARTVSENARGAPGGAVRPLLDEDFPDVQSWLRPAKSQPSQAQKVYPYADLKVSSNAKLNGVDGRRREEYLSEVDFERLFNMPRMAFQRLPEWKRNDLKRRLDLY